MVRSPCCEKIGLKRGPWTAEEDQILVFHIQRYGHGNWRAVPKQAGLLRCGKSCRLRWTNYLRPDIKRGNFTTEDEETIIKLHEMLGNRWSAIAARLPGRTDNEIKNVWHTYLKKRLNPAPATQEPKLKSVQKNAANLAPTTLQSKTNTIHQSHADPVVVTSASTSTSQSSGDFSCSETDLPSVTRGNNWEVREEDFVDFSSEQFLELDECFWRDALSLEDSGVPMEVLGQTPEGQFFLNDFLHDDYDMDSLLKVMADVGDLPEI